MREQGVRVLGDVTLDLLPVVVIGADAFAVTADRQKPGEPFDVRDEPERALTDAGIGAPALVTGQSFLILFREGFEIVLLLSVLLGYLEAARSLMVRAAEVELGGGRADMLALMAKLMASEAAQDITLKGMHLMGGFGYSRELPMQRWFRDVRLWSFAPLNNEMVRNRIGERLLGLPRSY